MENTIHIATTTHRIEYPRPVRKMHAHVKIV